MAHQFRAAVLIGSLLPATYASAQTTQLPSTVYIWPMAQPTQPVFGPPPTQSQNLMMASLAGIVNRSTNGSVLLSPNSGTQPQPRYWLDQLKAQYPSVQSQVQTSAGWFIDQYKSKLTGYVLFDPANGESINVATSIAGVTDAIMVSSATSGFGGQSTLSIAQSKGLAQIADARTMTSAQLYSNPTYGPLFNKDMQFHQAPTFDHSLRDYAVMKRGFVHWASATNLAPYAAGQNKQGRIFGWGDNEFDLFNQASQNNQQVVASNHNWSSSATAQWKVPLLDQKQHPSPNVVTKTGKHYVSFVMSDGDNATWLTNGMGTDPKYFGSPHRGKFNMTWDFTPSLADMNPVAHNFFYANANDGTAPNKPGSDTFVAAGGYGTAFPSQTPDINAMADSIAASMDAADLRVTSILDSQFIVGNKLEVILNKPQVTGMMFKTYDNYYRGRNGQIVWRNGKPIVTAKYSLWDGAESAQELVGILNAAPTNPLDDAGSYSIINVHPWSITGPDGTGTGDPMSNLNYLVEQLKATGDKVEVVGLEELMVHLRNHFGTPIEGAKVSATWIRDSSSNWNTTTRTNWSGALPNFIDTTVNFGAGYVTGNRTVTVSQPITAGTLNFNNAVHSFTLAGTSTLTLDVTDGPARINVTAGTHTINTPLTLADHTTIDVAPASAQLNVGNIQTSSATLTKTGLGTLKLTGPNAHTGGTIVDSGTLIVAHPNALGAGPIAINNTANVRVEPSLSQALQVAGVSTAGTGRLDLTNNAMVVKNSDLATIRALIAAGGLTSSTVANDLSELTAVGFASNADTDLTEFQGVTNLDENDVLLRITTLGDSNLDGETNLDDFPLFIAGLENKSFPQTWYYGDYNHSGEVDVDDFPLFLHGLENGGVARSDLSEMIGLSTLSESDKQALISAIPEPGVFALCSVAACGQFLKRRRRLV